MVNYRPMPKINPSQSAPDFVANAKQWHCGGLGFDSPRLHHTKLAITLSSQDEAVVAEMWQNGASLCQVWRDWKRLYLVEGVSVKDSCQLFLAHLSSGGKSKRYIQEFAWTLKHLARTCGDNLTIGQHNSSSMWGALDAMRATETARRKVAIFLNWCFEQGYCAHKIKIPCSVSIPKGEIEVLNNQQVKALKDACPDDLIFYLWLCLFLGVRPAEARRVDNIHYRDECLIVGAFASKTKTRRVIELPAGFTHYAHHKANLVNLRKRMALLREQAGVHYWPRNCMRHTAASHWLNRLQSADAAALHLGNSPVMLHRHYKALVTRKESQEFFDIWKE